MKIQTYSALRGTIAPLEKSCNAAKAGLSDKSILPGEKKMLQEAHRRLKDAHSFLQTNFNKPAGAMTENGEFHSVALIRFTANGYVSKRNIKASDVRKTAEGWEYRFVRRGYNFAIRGQMSKSGVPMAGTGTTVLLREIGSKGEWMPAEAVSTLMCN